MHTPPKESTLLWSRLQSSVGTLRTWRGDGEIAVSAARIIFVCANVLRQLHSCPSPPDEIGHQIGLRLGRESLPFPLRQDIPVTEQAARLIENFIWLADAL